MRLPDIRENFPLPGEYHFRFKYLYHKLLIWLDLSNESADLPTVDGKVYVKALRLSWGEGSKESDPGLHHS